ncbi:MscS mechanosensitive ion channel [Erythrobacter sp. QSSC1-22B]|uniref:mechanosensitive ion channel domain-containing protein n=1 Tax=Erythrobacter sp. QSSC1-22B TaxID=1860125 RepID=UPI000804DED8|nr:mechanosensitive ion channel domain-containing protein [Erythrobacter sp. QSSC1-22B]OBX19772.1 MscS mechanosensitive ion channel [Erythrobacter sp. QSSC1-22B]
MISRLPTLLFALLLLLPASAASAASAVIPGLEAPEAPAAEAPAQTIDDTQDSGSDARIAARIRGIFRELPAFAAVDVAANQGVVALSGTVPDEGDIARAQAIAGRVSGVVTVENAIERDVSVDASLGGLTSIGDRIDGLARMLPLLAIAFTVALVIILLGYLLAGLTGLWRRIAPNPFLAELIASAIRFVAVVVGVVIALDMIGAGALMGAVLGGAGLVGVALGFAMRETIENYVASLMLSLRQPFRANELVQIGDLQGRVIRLTSRATVLMTLDGNHLRIPNSQVFKAVIINFTRNPQRRFEFDLGVDADDDAGAARMLGRDTLATLPFVLKDPPPEARIVEVGDSNVVIRFLGWVDQNESDWFKAQSLMILAVKQALEAGGFAMPEPIYRLRLDPRSATVPFENINDTRRDRDAPRAAPPTDAPANPAPPHEDLRPTDEVAQMVDAERAAGAGEQDLLDSSRPVE